MIYIFVYQSNSACRKGLISVNCAMICSPLPCDNEYWKHHHSQAAVSSQYIYHPHHPNHHRRRRCRHRRHHRQFYWFSSIWKEFIENVHSTSCLIAEHYSDVIMGAIAYHITSLTIVHWPVYPGADQRKHQSSASLAFVRGIHRWPVNSPHKGPVTRIMFPFDDVIMDNHCPWHPAQKWFRNDWSDCTGQSKNRCHVWDRHVT